MKQLFPFLSRPLLLAFLLLSCPAWSQNFHVVDTLKAHPELTGGMESPYRFVNYPQTPAPKGYKAFYLSHYGRHGSRYGWDSKMYTHLHTVFSDASAENALTPKGETFWKRYQQIYQQAYLNTGDLTDLGWQQQNALGKEIYHKYPEIFKGKAKVNAISSTSGRTILSMGAFLTGLQGENPKLEITGNALHQNMIVTSTTFTPKEMAEKYKGETSKDKWEASSSFSHRTIPYDDIMSVFFKDAKYLDKKKISRTEFLYQMIDFIMGYKNYEMGPKFDDFLSTDQLISIWEAHNYYIYCAHSGAFWQYIPLLRDFITKADDAINGNNIAADLRFGHDHVFNPFMTLLNVNGERRTPKADDLKYWYQTYNTPMAANFLLILYKNKQGNVIFKMTRNGQEVELPQLQPVSGPYYAWSDLHKWFDKMLLEHPRIQ